MRNKINIRFPKLKENSYDKSAKHNEETVSKRLEQLAKRGGSLKAEKPEKVFHKAERRGHSPVKSDYVGSKPKKEKLWTLE